MKIVYLFLAVLTLIAACASSSNNKSRDYENLVSLHEPEEQPHQPSKVYIDSVKQIVHEQEAALLIHGTFPDACTNIEEVIHSVENDSLYLEIKAWRNTEQMCAQVLTPFSYIYKELSKEHFAEHTEININGTAYSF